MTTTTPNLYNESVRRLADGFSSEFAEFCAGDERIHELMMELASEFVETNIPVVGEDSQEDVASELIMSITVTKV
jgi:hypothetical protein